MVNTYVVRDVLCPQVVDGDALVHRILGDLIDCARFIDDPKKLKEKFIDVHARHIHDHVSRIQTYTHTYTTTDTPKPSTQP